MKHLIVANWKCNPVTLREAKRLFNSVKRGIKNIKNTEVVICPPFVWLTPTYAPNPKLGAQDCFWEEKGAFTGEISPPMLRDSGCQYVIIGHSERRKILGETDEMINKKIKATLAAKLKIILCIGETEEERKKGKTFKILQTQLEEDLKGIENCKLKIENFIFAYEPIWAIGTGNPCSPKEAKKVNIFIRKTLHQLTGSSTYQVLYGGSVNSENALSFIREASFSGLLVGGASLNAKEFIKLIRNASEN